MGGTETQRFSTSSRLGLDTLDGLDSLDTLDGLDTLDKVEEVGFEVKETAPTAGYSVPDVPAADFDDLPCFEAPRKLFGSCHRACFKAETMVFSCETAVERLRGMYLSSIFQVYEAERFVAICQTGRCRLAGPHTFRGGAFRARFAGHELLMDQKSFFLALRGLKHVQKSRVRLKSKPGVPAGERGRPVGASKGLRRL